MLARLPPATLPPPDLVAAALQRLRHAAALLGAVEIVGTTELSPVWRLLLKALANVEVRRNAAPRTIQAWLAGSGIVI